MDKSEDKVYLIYSVQERTLQQKTCTRLVWTT